MLLQLFYRENSKLYSLFEKFMHRNMNKLPVCTIVRCIILQGIRYLRE